jgi:hypothetical protein
MKNKFQFLSVLLTVCIFTTTAFAQTAPGTGAGSPAPGSVAGLPAAGVSALTFDFGTSGTLSIPSTSPYFAIIESTLTYMHATIDAQGLVTFPSVASYHGCLLPLYYTGCINYKTYQTCKSQPPVCTPPPSCTPAPKSCGY